MTIIYVTYPGDEGTRFDRDHYVRDHLPPVIACWGPLVLQSCTAFWPADPGAEKICIAECRLRDEAAMRAALASPEMSRVMADVACFTDALPTQSLAGRV